MNKLTEQVDLYWRGLKNWNNVVAARWNSAKKEAGVLAPDVEHEADRRLQICLQCPFNSINAQTSTEYKALYGKPYTTHRDTIEHCAICKCQLTYKVLAMAECCGLQAWNNEHPEQFQDLKWLAYKPQTNV